MKKVLLLIDVQRWYVKHEHADCLDYIQKIVEEYSKNNLPIFNLVFDDPLGTTVVASVKKQLKRTKGVWHFNKSQPNGSKEVETMLKLKGLLPGKVKLDVCGFYSNLCVLKTVSGLKKAGYKIVVHYAGTGSGSRNEHYSGIHRMKKAGIEIVK